MIAVGRRIGSTDPSLEGFDNILCLTKSTPYGSLSPYALISEIVLSNGVKINANLENIWQFSKLYPTLNESIQNKSRYDSTVIWRHPAEVHVKDGVIQKEYWLWRDKGFATNEAIRYPVGFNDRHKCMCSVHFEDGQYEFLNYVNARKKIYLPNYLKSLDNLTVNSVGYEKLNTLRSKLRSGENILIIEIDGPHYESMSYYKENYSVNDDFIFPNNTSIINKEKLHLFLNDTKHPFGHGYCLAWKLLHEIKN